MICEKCKVRDANIMYTEIVNGVKSEHNICSQCAKDMDLGPYSAIFDGEFSLGKLLSSLLGVNMAENENATNIGIACPNCGTSYDEFVKNSRFGCADCYNVFDLLLGDKIKNLQISDQHKGKIPKMVPTARKTQVTPLGEVKLSDDEEVENLRRKLKAAIAEEDYEEAAKLRDMIHGLEDK